MLQSKNFFSYVNLCVSYYTSSANLNAVFPRSAVCTSSEVFRTIKEESTMTATEMEKEKRKWTTFLQKPNRPIPKTKLEQEQEIKRQQYRVQIVKQQKPKVAPDRIPTPPVLSNHIQFSMNFIISLGFSLKYQKNRNQNLSK